MIIETILNYVLDRTFVYQLIATVTSYSAIRIILFFRARRRRYQIFKYYAIPGPEPRLLDGNLYRYKADKASFKIDDIFRREYGKYFGTFIGDEPGIHTTDLDIIKAVFIDETKSFRERSLFFVDSSLTDGILLASHDRWKLFRKVMSPVFNNFNKRAQSSTLFIEESIRLMLDYIEDKIKVAEANGAEMDIDLHELMKSTALHVISGLAIKLPGVQVMENEKYVTSIDAFLALYDNGIIDYAIKFPFLSGIIGFLAKHLEHGMTMSQINRNLNTRIDEGLKRYASGKGSDKSGEQQLDLVNQLIKLHYEGKLSRREVIGNVEALLFAGYDTTSTTLTYLFWALAKYPDIQEKLRSEIMAHGYETKYLEQVINETMRLYPTVIHFASRLATETVKIGQLIIPQGTKVHYNSWLIHRDADLWPEPEKFNPDRFSDPANLNPYAFAPFGLGERKCLGMKLAMLEMKMVVCDLLMRYRILLKSPDQLDLISYSVVLSKPRDKVVLGFERL